MNFSSNKAFSLIELISVIAIIVFMTALAGPAIGVIRSSRGLESATVSLANLAERARAEAVSRGTPVAMVMAKSGPSAYRAASIMVWDSAANQWRQTDKWEIVPEGILAIPESAAPEGLSGSKFFQSTEYAANLSDLRCGEQMLKPIADYAYQIFLPDGRLAQAPSPCTILLAEGNYNGAQFELKHGAVNYALLLISDLTGRVKVTRPE